MRRFRNRKISQKAKKIAFCGTVLLIVTLFISWAFEKTEPILLVLAENQFKDIVTNTVYENTEDLELTNIVEPYYNDSGNITSIKTQAYAINKATTEIINGIDRELGDKDINLKIPIGDIVGDSLSLGKGPYVVVQLNQYKSTDVKIKSEFEAVGINQTIHRLNLQLEIEAVLLLPGLHTEKVYATLMLPLSETLIVGAIPDTYINTKN